MRPDQVPLTRTGGRLSTWMRRSRAELERQRMARVPRARIQVGPRGVFLTPIVGMSADESIAAGADNVPRWA